MKQFILLFTFLTVVTAQNYNSNKARSPKIIKIMCSYEECQDYLFFADDKESYLSFLLKEDTQASVVIYTKSGKYITNLCNEILPSGKNYIYWNGLDKEGSAINEPVYIHVCRLQKVLLRRNWYSNKQESFFLPCLSSSNVATNGS